MAARQVLHLEVYIILAIIQMNCVIVFLAIRYLFGCTRFIWVGAKKVDYIWTVSDTDRLPW